MATLLARPPEIPSREPTPAPPHLTLNTTAHGHPSALPNKHLPFCSPGSNPDAAFPSPPATPPSKDAAAVSSLLYPPAHYEQLNADPPVYGLSGSQLAAALDNIAAQPLPDPKLVFPWLHGIHIENQLQLAYFSSRRRVVPATPGSLRAITIVKAGGSLTEARIKGAIAPDELLEPAPSDAQAPGFREVDPKIGFSVRNFQIQAAKIATVSDIVVYGDDSTPRSEVEHLSAVIALAQRNWLDRNEEGGKFNTFLLKDSFAKLEREQPQIVALDGTGSLTGNVVDFAFQERLEMCALSRASEIVPNVSLGPTPDARLLGTSAFASNAPNYDITVEASDFGRIPNEASLKKVENLFAPGRRPPPGQVQLEFPASGSMSIQCSTEADIEGLVMFCRWLYKLTQQPANGAKAPSVLIHCADGYTESTLLGLAFVMFAEGITLEEAWIRLHREKKRNFFAYPSDKLFLQSIEEQILRASPLLQGKKFSAKPCAWLDAMDGSLPSRILPYLYLGNLNHAQNPEMLRKLGVSRILSIGEPIKWSEDQIALWGKKNLAYIDKVQDNGVDPLTCEFDRCLAFIEATRNSGRATLVHCRVGVSRSATICIAEVMKEHGLSFPKAYCFVRARRLNVIIQPHLRFTYELLKWEEYLRQQRGLPLRRELEWAHVCREIAAMNRPYCRS